MTSSVTQAKRLKVSDESIDCDRHNNHSGGVNENDADDSALGLKREFGLDEDGDKAADAAADQTLTIKAGVEHNNHSGAAGQTQTRTRVQAARSAQSRQQHKSKSDQSNVDDLSDETDQENEADEDYEEEEEEEADEDEDDDGDDDDDQAAETKLPSRRANLQEQLAASGPAGVAAAAAIATVRKRKRPHTFETNPSVRKRQQTRLIRKLRACIDEYTARVGQQAVVLITMPGKTAHNFKVFGAQPLESVVRSCKQEIMSELEQAVLEQTPIKVTKDDSGKHELPPLVIDGIPTPVEKMTQAQLRAFIPLMLKYSTGRGKPGWGKESTRPPWWPTTLPWANVRSDARDDGEKQRISWTTTLREIVTNCYKYHGREDLLPIFDEDEEDEEGNGVESDSAAAVSGQIGGEGPSAGGRLHNNTDSSRPVGGGLLRSQRPLGSASTRLRQQQHQHQQQQQQHQQQQQQQQQQQLIDQSNNAAYYTTAGLQQQGYVTTGPASTGQFMQTIQNADGSVSLIQVDPANAQILTLPDGTQVRAVRLQTCLGAGSAGDDGQLATGTSGELQTIDGAQLQHQHQQPHLIQAGQQAEVGPDGQIILTSEDGTQSCYPMSQLVSIPASVYQQFAATGQPLQIITADGTSLAAANTIQIHTIQEAQEISAAEASADSDEQRQHMQQVGGGGSDTVAAGDSRPEAGDAGGELAGMKDEGQAQPAQQQQRQKQEQQANKGARNQRHAANGDAPGAQSLNGDDESFFSSS